MLLGETVPRFRRDLKIERKGDAGGLYEVTDPNAAEKHFTLYDFELSIARMLDGKRTWQQVFEAGTKLGIPVTPESLEKFERQLSAYGFLLPAGTEPTGDGSWAPRDEWSPEMREMFRTALLKFRQNRFEEAGGYLNAMLAMDAKNAEATEVLAAIAAKKTGSMAATDVAPIPVIPRPGAAPAAAAPDLDPASAPAAAEAPAAEAAAAPAEAAAAQPAGPSPLEAAVDAARRLPAPAWAMLGGAAVMAVIFSVPLPRTVTASVVLEAPGSVLVRAPHNLLVKAVASANGQWVDPGAPLLTLDPAGDPERLKPYEAKIAQLQTHLNQTRATVSKKQIASWEKNVKQVEKDLAGAKAALGRAKPKQLAAAQKKVADKERELVEARAELDDATKQRAMATVQEQLDEAVASRDRAAAEGAVLNATNAGVVAELAAGPGQHVASGDPIARILDSQELLVACTVNPKDASSLEAGQPIDVTVKGKPLQLAVESIDGAKVSARIKNDQRAFAPGDTGEAKISVAARSIWGRMFK